MSSLEMQPATPPLVLVVDDDREHTEIVAALLERRGLRVARAADAPSGVELAARLRPDVVLLDVCMPRVDGLSAAEHLQRNPLTRDVPILFLTAAGEFLRARPSARWLAKPFHADELYGAVEGAIARRKAR